MVAWTKVVALRGWEVGFGQDRLPNAQRPLENEDVGRLVLGLLSGDSDRFITPKVGNSRARKRERVGW